jgi:hypothetical protein
MRIKLFIAAVMAVILATAGVTLASASSDSAATGDAQVISLFSTEDQFAVINVDQSAGTAPTLGDELVFRDTLHAGGRAVGTDAAVCTIVKAPTDVLTTQCVATFVLTDRGQITAQGLVSLPAADQTGFKFDLAVTGGTGDFEGASGRVTIEILNSDGDANVTFHLID